MKLFIIFALLFSVVGNAKSLNESYLDFKKLVEQTNDWRNRTIDFLIEIEEDTDRIISNKELTRIHEGALEYKELRDQFYTIINEVRYISEFPAKNVTFIEDKKLGPEDNSSSLYYEIIRTGGNVFAMLMRKFDKPDPTINIDLCNEWGRELSTKFKMGFASALILYDNYALVMDQINSLERRKKLNMVINNDNPELKNFLVEIEKQYSSLKNFKSMKNSLEIYQRINDELIAKELEKDSIELFIDNTVISSYIYSRKDKLKASDVWKRRKKLAIKWIKQNIIRRTEETTNELSKFFGNTVGLVATRRGKLSTLPKTQYLELKEKLLKTLKPMDVLLEKTPFRLTDKFIPGHWGHAAIWLGTKEQLIESGQWKELPQPIKERIASGHNILEALRPGVEINSLDHFLNVDDLAILRPNFVKTDEELNYHLIKSVEQFGKEYDFNFDVETDKTIVCSELVYVVFNNEELKWPLDKTLGRNTISPDHVAQKATETSISNTEFSFTPIRLYTDGIEVKKSNIQSKFEELLNN